jgi:1-acyl-sn-glycerol-3-phosphate acyltransferase
VYINRNKLNKALVITQKQSRFSGTCSILEKINLLIYKLLKLPIRLALRIFCVDIDLVNPQFKTEKGPLLLVANHPNSFLDAILIASEFSEPVHFLARGDAFRKPWHRFLLGLLQMIPVYRLSEGRENLHLNEYAFIKSQELIAQQKIVLIFIEGICLNTHELLPFKKGAARIAISAINENQPLQIMPVSITYNNFNGIGKNVRIELSKPVSAKLLLPHNQDVLNMQHFNREITAQLNGMIEMPHITKQKQNNFFFLFSLIGLFLHQPLYQIIKKIVRDKTRKTVFYDSVLFGVLLLSYPMYLLLLLALMSFVHLPSWLIVAVILIHPLSAYIAVRYKIKPQTST